VLPIRNLVFTDVSQVSKMQLVGFACIEGSDAYQ
jgi:hypothetical protein